MHLDTPLDRLCGLSSTARVWFALYSGGGAYRYTDILQAIGCSRSKLTSALAELTSLDLLRRVEGKYQAVRPDALGSEQAKPVYDAMCLLREWLEKVRGD